MKPLASVREPEDLDVRGKVPPNDVEAERVLLSSVAGDPGQFALAAGKGLEAAHFYSEANRRIWEGMVDLSAAGSAIDYTEIGGWLRDRHRFNQAGGAEYLAHLALGTAASVHVEQLAERIINFARLRSLIATAQKIAAEGYTVGGDQAQSFIDAAEAEVFELAQKEQRIEIAPMADVVHESYTRMLAAEARQGAVELPTGLERLDKSLGGLGRGRVTVFAARPGMGKTGIVTGIADNLASNGELVAFFSIEMPRWQLATRMACARVGASTYRALNGWLHNDERAMVLGAESELKTIPLWIDDTPAISLLQIRAKCRLVAAKARKKLSLVVVDYLQLIRGPREKNTSRDEQLSDVTAGFKRLAKEMDCAVVYLSQLNREVEKRPDKRPQLSDLRESGGIEQDSDDVVFIYRPEYYLKEKTPDEDKGVAELVIAKQRNGPTNTVRVRFHGRSVAFSNLGLPDQQEEQEDG